MRTRRLFFVLFAGHPEPSRVSRNGRRFILHLETEEPHASLSVCGAARICGETLEPTRAAGGLASRHQRSPRNSYLDGDRVWIDDR